MVNSHSHSFFGQNTGLIVNSSSREESFIFFRCIKRKPDGIWEKPTSGEGKVIKCTLDEIVMILQVLNRDLLTWQSFHTYKDIKTPISFSWEDEKAKILWINIANYSKMLKFAQAEILKLLISHVLKEKIKYSTSSNKHLNNIKNRENDASQKTDFKKKDNIDNSLISPIINSKPKIKEVSNIDGIIKSETEKALLIDFDAGKEIWIPKSTIRCQYVSDKNLTQKFSIDNWILNRNKITS
jgi:hypothetical protein